MKSLKVSCIKGLMKRLSGKALAELMTRVHPRDSRKVEGENGL